MKVRKGDRMVEVVSHLTQTEWLKFNEQYFRFNSKSKRWMPLLLLVIYFFLLLIYGTKLFSSMRSFPVSLPVSEVLGMLLDEILLIFIFGVFFVYELFQAYSYYSPSYIRKKLSKQLNDHDFEGSRVCLTEESVATYSDSMDLRLSWKRIEKIIHTDELIVLFGSHPQCIVITKKSLTDEGLQQVHSKLESSFSGSVMTL